MNIQIRLWMIAAVIGLSSVVSAKGTSDIVDVVVFGNTESEQQHQLEPGRSEIITGGLGESARRLLPPEAENWEGGRMAFTLKVDPQKTNYVTIRLWGSEINRNRLILYCEGKQIGYLHLGDIEILDFGTEEPAYTGRFYYNTNPLPESLTQGKTQLKCEIRSHGPIWRYGGPFEQYQKKMTEPTRGIYKMYMHSDGFFVPPANEKQGEIPSNTTVRKEPGPEMIDKVKERVNREIDKILKSNQSANQMQMQFIATAYYVKWTAAYKNPKVIQLVIDSADKLYADFKKDPKVAELGPASYNLGWFGLGPVGDSVRLLAGELGPRLDEKLPDGTIRRNGWSEMLCYSRDWHRLHRRLYTNQSQINDLYGIYLSNRGVAVVDPQKAFPELKIRRYLYESLGLEPWRDSDQDSIEGMEAGNRNWGIGNDYWQLTQKGLTRELGYVGGYGEVLDWVTTIYNATRPTPDQSGDPKIKTQLEKMARARAVFRYPTLDADGNRAMRLETIVGWRDMHYPGEVCYGERVAWDGSAIYAAANTLDAESVGYAQQMFDDNQFFESLRERMKDAGFRVTAGLLGVPDQYETLKAQARSSHRLPMTPGRPNFIFSDEENGVVAIKNGSDILYASLYWRARNAINFLARVHYITPQIDRLATVRQETEFEPSGMIYTRPDHIDFGFDNGGHKYPGDLHSAYAGEKLPIAKIPDGIKFRPGDENVYAGKGSFYTLRYGEYLIAMNCTADKTYQLKIPDEYKQASELMSSKKIQLDKAISVAPLSTVVLYNGK